MKSDRLLWPRGTVATRAWARGRPFDDDAFGEGQPLATMSEETRASVIRQARKNAPPEDEQLVDELTALIGELFYVHGWLTQMYINVKDSVGLTGTEALTLYAVVNSTKPVTVPQIGRAIGHARQVIQRAANTLVERGFLETRENPSHKRAALLVPTPAGQTVKDNFDRAGRLMTETLAEGMDLKSVLAAKEGFRQLSRIISRRARTATASGKTKPAG